MRPTAWQLACCLDGLVRALGVLPCWMRIAGVADSLLAEGSRPGPGQGLAEGPGIRPCRWPI